MFKIGIEQEFVFLNEAGEYVDADNTTYSEFAEIVDQFPVFEGDDRHLDCKSLETYPKRCYVEGFERHDSSGTLVETLPKALEIRTTPHKTIGGAVTEFRASWNRLMGLAQGRGLIPALTSRHPFKNSLDFFENLGAEESLVRSEARLKLARRAMFTHGLHVNVSLEGYSESRLQDLVAKVNYYTPSIIPWSYSSPFYLGELFEGLCSRNYYRASTRNMVDLNDRKGTHVIEFRGFDACGDHQLLDAVLRLFVGVLLDESLPGRSLQQDSNRLMQSSIMGFGDPSIGEECRQILLAVQRVSGDDPEPFSLLESMLDSNVTYASRMKQRYSETGSIKASISEQFRY